MFTGDNDHLAALVTNLSSADLLVILSSVPGVYRNGSDHEVIPEVDVGASVDEQIAAFPIADQATATDQRALRVDGWVVGGVVDA